VDYERTARMIFVEASSFEAILTSNRRIEAAINQPKPTVAEKFESAARDKFRQRSIPLVERTPAPECTEPTHPRIKRGISRTAKRFVTQLTQLTQLAGLSEALAAW